MVAPSHLTAALLAGLALAGCVHRVEVRPDRLPLDPTSGRSGQAVVLAVPAAVAAVEAPVAGPPPFGPSGGALAFHAGIGMGLSRQVEGVDLFTFHLTGGFGWAGSHLRLGIEGGYEAAIEGAFQTGWVGIGGGWGFAAGLDQRLELGGSIGRRFFAPTGSGNWFEARNVSGGGADLGYAAGRIVLWLGRRQLAWGVALWAERTLGSASTTYRVEQCGFLGCSLEVVPVRYGGGSVGLSLLLGAQTIPAPRHPGSDRPGEAGAD